MQRRPNRRLMGRIAGGIATVLLAAHGSGEIVFAQDVPHTFPVTRLTPSYTGLRGGSGGTPYNLSCTDGQVLIGVNARTTVFVENIQGICRPVTGAGAWTGSNATTPSTGGVTGFLVSTTCPANFAVSGFRGRKGMVLDQIALECTRLASNGSFDTTSRTMLSTVGGPGGTAFSLTRCSRPAQGLRGKSGGAIDSMQIVCENAPPLMTTAQVDAALTSGTSLLKTDADGTGSLDVACAVNLSRSGRVRIEPSNGLFAIDDLTELNRAFDIGGFVVVNAINFCSGLGTNIIGCAPRPSSPPPFGRAMVVVPFLGGTAVERGALWAHEFGHTRGLPHRDSSALNLMFPTINSGGRINGTECTAFRNK